MAGEGKKSGSVAEIVLGLAEPEAAALGLEIWDVRFVKEGGTRYLRIIIDHPERGVSIEDCEALSRRMDPVLDEADPIAESYCLEVWSPGMNRELRTPAHFEKMLGRPVRVRLFRPDESGSRELYGQIAGSEEDSFSLTLEDGSTRSILRKDVTVVRLADEDDFAL
ncbi:MAG: ribosome maturation factor RimP [Oscillospiraceae bacterium]|nr:ribosome maturation factor RimP [Oscillospiraceae bacterium]MBQ8732083.1 ribosome maturation factor RimP [Oscillospiraceae bacterium]